MSVYRQIGGGSLQRSVFIITLFHSLKKMHAVAYKHEKWQQDLQPGGWLPSGFYFLPFVYLYFFLQDKVYNGKGKALSLFCGFSESKTDVWISREKEVFTNRTVG